MSPTNPFAAPATVLNAAIPTPVIMPNPIPLTALLIPLMDSRAFWNDDVKFLSTAPSTAFTE